MPSSSPLLQARSSSHTDILGLGVVAVDDLCHVASYPPTDAKAEVLRQERCFGGLIGNALATAARLGARCSYAGTLGRDDLSNFAAAALRREGIDLSRVERNARSGPVHSHIIVGRDRGTRNIFFDCGRLAPLRRRVLWETTRQPRVLLIDHYDVPGKLAAIRLARKSDIPVVADFEGADDPLFPELLAGVDHLILSHDFALKLGLGTSPAAIARALWNETRQAVVITCGAKGCWHLTASDRKKPAHFPAFAVKTVDTTGCGDVFHGAYAAGLAQRLPLEERLRLATAAAALKAARPAGPEAVPRLADVRRFLRQAGQPPSHFDRQLKTKTNHPKVLIPSL